MPSFWIVVQTYVISTGTAISGALNVVPPGCPINVSLVVIASAGIKKIWDGVGEGWVLAKNEIYNYPITIAKAIKQNFDYVATSNNIKRVQTAVRADYGIGIRFAKWLGLKNEGLMKHYGMDGSDHYRFARIF